MDRYEKEPIRNLLRYVVGGAVMCVPAFFGELGFQRALGTNAWQELDTHPLLFTFVVFAGIAFVEELCKFGVLRFFARRDHEIDEPFDWIVYAVSVSLGFATLENLLYVANFGLTTGILRAFTAVPAHALNGTLMGDRLARAAVERGRGASGSARRQALLAVVEPTLWHGAYDFCALGASSTAGAGATTLGLLLTGGLFALLGAQWFVGVRRVRSQQRISLSLHAQGLAHRGGSRVPPILLTLGRRGTS
jgi:RsiW-degrading membrane proteinase PrsW (M82 family)